MKAVAEAFVELEAGRLALAGPALVHTGGADAGCAGKCRQGYTMSLEQLENGFDVVRGARFDHAPIV